jgi:hypothetical protein
MGSVVISGATSGAVTLAVPAEAGTRTLTLPAETGTAVVKNGDGDVTLAGALTASTTAKAWVNIDGTGTVAIRDSYNVSSITDDAAGVYTVNFSNNMTDTNYASNATLQRENQTANYANVYGSFATDTYSTSAFKIRSLYIGVGDSATGYTDAERVSVTVFGS